MSEKIGKIESVLPLKNSGPHPLMGSVNIEELVEMKSMKGVSLQESEEMLKVIDQQIKELEERIGILKHEKDKIALKYIEDNPI